MSVFWYNLFDEKIQTHYNVYQPYMILDFSFSFENDIAHDDICRAIIKITDSYW